MTSGWWVASYLALWVLVVVLCVIVVALARQIGTLHLRLGPRGALEMDDEGPPLGQPLAPIETRDIEEVPIRLGGGGRRQLLLFVSPGCRVCEMVLPSLSVIAAVGALDPILVTDLDAEETRLAYGHKPTPAPLIAGPSIFATYDVPGTPFVLVLDERGIVTAKGTVNNLEQLEGLIETATQREMVAR